MRYPADVPEGTLVELFLEAVERFPEQIAYASPSGDPSRTFTYNDVESQVRRGARALSRSGIKRGDRIALISENRAEWALTDWMCQCTGVVDVPLYPTLTAPQAAYILQDSGASLVFVSNADQAAKAKDATKGFGQKAEIVAFERSAAGGGVTSWDEFLSRGDDQGSLDFRSEARKVGPGDLATMIYTSGTTGTPKGVMLTHGNLAGNIWQARHALRVRNDDVTVSFLPLSHVFQRMVDYLLFSSGCRIVHGTIEGVADDLKRARPTIVVSVPRLYEKVYQKVKGAGGLKGKLVSWAVGVGRRVALLKEAGKPPAGLLKFKYGLADKLVFAKLRQGLGGRLRFFVSGGAALAPEINRFFLGAGVTILEGYGLTETSPVTNVNTFEHFRLGTVGRPVPGTEIRIAGDGEILIRGPQVMKGYYKMEGRTREVISEDGWFSTGDIGNLSSDGFLTITDRKKDLIKTSGGKYVAPQAIENLLKKNAFIDQAVVVGEGRKFVAVLVVPAFDFLAAQTGANAAERGKMLDDPATQTLLEEAVFSRLRDLARFERPKKIGLIAEPFTIEDGTLTPTQKVKRNRVNEIYAALVDEFYKAESVDRTVFVARRIGGTSGGAPARAPAAFAGRIGQRRDDRSHDGPRRGLCGARRNPTSGRRVDCVR